MKFEISRGLICNVFCLKILSPLLVEVVKWVPPFQPSSVNPVLGSRTVDISLNANLVDSKEIWYVIQARHCVRSM